MPATTQSQQTKVQTLQTALAAVKLAISNAISAADDVAVTAAALNTADGAHAANAGTRLQGILYEARGRILQGHADASDALVNFDATYGAAVVQGGGGGRR